MNSCCKSRKLTAEGQSRNELGGLRKWEELPLDCLTNIFQRAGMKSLILKVPFVCKTWYKESFNPNCWKNLDFRCFQSLDHQEHLKPQMIEFAVKRSQSLATKVVIADSTLCKTEDVLDSFSIGCPALKDLEISMNLNLPSSTPRYIQNWKNLESLKILSFPSFFKEVLEQIGIHCKKFTGLSTILYGDDDEVSAIVNFIPNVKYLSLGLSHLSRESLILILSKCKELVYLNVGDCEGFDSYDAEITRMASHIKMFISGGLVVQCKKMVQLKQRELDELSKYVEGPTPRTLREDVMNSIKDLSPDSVTSFVVACVVAACTDEDGLVKYLAEAGCQGAAVYIRNYFLLEEKIDFNALNLLGRCFLDAGVINESRLIPGFRANLRGNSIWEVNASTLTFYAEQRVHLGVNVLQFSFEEAQFNGRMIIEALNEKLLDAVIGVPSTYASVAEFGGNFSFEYSMVWVKANSSRLKVLNQLSKSQRCISSDQQLYHYICSALINFRKRW